MLNSWKHTQKNRTNSHWPPSSDSFRPRTSLRKKTGKRPSGTDRTSMSHAPKGGNPHHIVVHRVTHAKAAGYPWNTFLLFGISHPASMGSSIVADKGDSTRMRNQSCPYCHRLHQAEFPTYVTSSVQYGPRVKALLVSILPNTNRFPNRRTTEFMKDIFGHRISEGTLVKSTGRPAASLPASVSFSTKPYCLLQFFTWIKRAFGYRGNGSGSM